MKKRIVVSAVFAVVALAIFVSTRSVPAPVSPSVVQAAAPEPPPTLSNENMASVANAAPADFGATSLAVPPAPDFKKVVAFNDWAQRWKAADDTTRDGMKAEGVRLAAERRPEFKALIARDPQRALEQAVPRVIAQDLPAEIVAQLERPVSAMGNLNVYRGRPQSEVAPGTELTLRYFETAKGESLKARVFGEMATLNSKRNVPLRGVAVDREFAVAENPVRQLETGERIPKDAPVVA